MANDNLAQNESAKPKLLLSEFLLSKNVNSKYIPNNQQPRSLVNCIDDFTGELINFARIGTSNITNMKNLFQNSARKDFGGIDKWNVSNVEKMQSMFNCAESFNQNLSVWGDKLGKVQKI